MPKKSKSRTRDKVIRRIPPEVIEALKFRLNRPPGVVLCALCNNVPAWRVVPVAPISGSRPPKQLRAILLCDRCIENMLPPGWLAFSLAYPDRPPRSNEVVYIPDEEPGKSADSPRLNRGERLSPLPMRTGNPRLLMDRRRSQKGQAP